MTNPLDAKTVVWCDPGAVIAASCPVCKTESLKPALLKTKSLVPSRGIITLLRCLECSNLFWNDVEVFAYEGGWLPWSTDFYVEQGAGVDALIEPIARLPPDRVRAYLEIGCGYGFSIDAAERLFGWRSVGVDPSPVAKAGRIGLGLDIRPIYATTDIDLGGPFDLVYASEVIEHVDKPEAFLAICAAHLAEDGVLTLSTPDAGLVRPDAPTAELVLALSPGLHLILYTAEGLRHLLRGAGFPHVEVDSRGHRLVAYASRRPIDFDTTAPLDRTLYQKYLKQVLDRDGLPSALQRGARYRLLKEFTNAGDYNSARVLLKTLAAEIEGTFGIDIEAPLPQFVMEAMRSGPKTGRFGAPWSLPGILYCAGMIAQNGDGDPGAAVNWFDLAGTAATRFRGAYSSIGIDDGETASLEEDAPRQSLLSLCRVDPHLAVARLLNRSPPATAAELELILITLTTLGRLEAAAILEAVVVGETGWRLLNARGMLTLLHHRDAPRAAKFFARAWAEAIEAYPPPQPSEWCRTKYNEVLAWITAGDAPRATAAAEELLAPEHGKWLTDETRTDLAILLSKHPQVWDLMKRD